MFGVKVWRGSTAEIVVETPERAYAERVYEGTNPGPEIRQVELYEDTGSGVYVIYVKQR